MTTIPAFQNSNKSRVSGAGEIYIRSRTQGGFGGTFKIEIDVKFDDVINEYPIGRLSINTNLSDSQNGIYKSENIEIITMHGKHNATAFLSGRINDELANFKGCKFWLMIANNSEGNPINQTPDVVSFTIVDNKGDVMAYGTGPVKSGDIKVSLN
ncbi:MAG: hypothetical protein KA188_00380 [Leadbetterella sp.]|nr:hypothetical protein [Leadbetterella sp.]